jgi:hypothetical protein
MFSLIFPFLIHSVCGTTGYPSVINFGVITWTSLSIPLSSFIFGSPLIWRWSNIGSCPGFKRYETFDIDSLEMFSGLICFQQVSAWFLLSSYWVFFSRLYSQVVDLNGYTFWLTWLQVMNFVSFALSYSVEDLFDDDDQRFLFYLQRENKFVGNRIQASMPLDSTLVPCSINNFIASFNLRHFVIPSKTCCSYWLVC